MWSTKLVLHTYGLQTMSSDSITGGFDSLPITRTHNSVGKFTTYGHLARRITEVKNYIKVSDFV